MRIFKEIRTKAVIAGLEYSVFLIWAAIAVMVILVVMMKFSLNMLFGAIVVIVLSYIGIKTMCELNIEKFVSFPKTIILRTWKKH